MKITPPPPLVTKALIGAGVIGAGGAIAYGTRDEREVLGHGREFWTGLGVGAGGALVIKAGAKLLPNMGVMDAMQRIPGGIPGKFAAATVVGTIPSYALLLATSGDRELLGQGHEFWTGAVWGLAGVALLKTVIPLSNLTSHGPLAAGWVAGDFVALGLNAALGSRDSAH